MSYEIFYGTDASKFAVSRQAELVKKFESIELSDPAKRIVEGLREGPIELFPMLIAIAEMLLEAEARRIGACVGDE